MGARDTGTFALLASRTFSTLIPLYSLAGDEEMSA